MIKKNWIYISIIIMLIGIVIYLYFNTLEQVILEKHVVTHTNALGIIKTDTTLIHKISPDNSKTSYDWVALLFPFLISAAGVFYNYWKDIKISKDKKIDVHAKPFDLSTHSLFLNIQILLSRDLNDILTLNTETRSKLFRDMIRKQLEIHDKYLKTFLTSTNNINSPINFHKEITMMLINIRNEYEQEWRNMDVPEIVIKKYKSTFEDEIISMDSRITNGILSMSAANPNVLYVDLINYCFITIDVVLIQNMIKDVKEILDKLNGEITGLNYKGGII